MPSLPTPEDAHIPHRQQQQVRAVFCGLACMVESIHRKRVLRSSTGACSTPPRRGPASLLYLIDRTPRRVGFGGSLFGVKRDKIVRQLRTGFERKHSLIARGSAENHVVARRSIRQNFDG